MFYTLSWEQRKFKEIASLRRGLTYTPESISLNGIKVLRPSNIDDNSFKIFDDGVFVEKDAVNIKTVNNGDILITSANGSPNLIGKHAIIKNLPNKSAVHGGFMLVAETHNYDFLNASMSSRWYKNFLNLYVAGGNGAIGNLNVSSLEDYNVLIPKNDE